MISMKATFCFYPIRQGTNFWKIQRNPRSIIELAFQLCETCLKDKLTIKQESEGLAATTLAPPIHLDELQFMTYAHRGLLSIRDCTYA